jgi:capsular polysaccharide biosynthesis protein
VSDPDQLLAWFRDEVPKPRLSGDDVAPGEESGAADLTGGLVNFGFFTAALRRSAWVWCLTAVLGLLIGSAMYVKYPPAYHATASVLLVDSSTQNPSVEVSTDLSLAQSEPVAAQVVRELKIPETVVQFQANCTITALIDTVVTLDVGAHSSADALQRVAALATAFLQYRAHYERIQQQELFTQLNKQAKGAQQELRLLQAEVSQLPLPPATAAQKNRYDSLETQITQQTAILQYVTSTESSTRANTTSMVTGSYVLDPATAVHRSSKKETALYVGGGLFGGLAIGMGIVLIAALLSRRLRRRDDVAIALGAPVTLSVGPLRRRRWPPMMPRQAAQRKLDTRRVVAYLRATLAGGSRGRSTLALVAVDDPQVVAQVAVSLASSWAADGKRVALADLSGGAYLARLLGVSSPGIHRVSEDGATLMVILPDPEDIAPVGPVTAGASAGLPTQAPAALITACSAADILLTMAVIDPSCSDSHLGTWATNAVALVTAGESSGEKLHSVGEIVRLGGARLDSVVLLGTDRSDESLGVIHQAQLAGLASHAHQNGLASQAQQASRTRGKPESVDPALPESVDPALPESVDPASPESD